MARAQTHKDVEYAVDDASGRSSGPSQSIRPTRQLVDSAAHDPFCDASYSVKQQWLVDNEHVALGSPDE